MPESVIALDAATQSALGLALGLPALGGWVGAALLRRRDASPSAG